MKSSLLALFAFLTVFASCKKEAIISSEEVTPPVQQFNTEEIAPSVNIPGITDLPGSLTVNIMAGQNIPVGTLTISNDANNMYVTYSLDGGYKLSETHLYAGSLEAMPVTSKGNAAPGQFPYKTVHTPPVSYYTYTIPLSSLSNSCNAVAAHAMVIKTGANGVQTFNQTGWGAGSQINPGGNWAMFNFYCTQIGDPGID